MSELEPADRSPVGFLWLPAFVQERLQVSIELGFQSFLVIGCRRKDDLGSPQCPDRSLRRSIQRLDRCVAKGEPSGSEGKPASPAEVPTGEPRGHQSQFGTGSLGF